MIRALLICVFGVAVVFSTVGAQEAVVDALPKTVKRKPPVALSVSKPERVSATESTVTVTVKMMPEFQIYAKQKPDGYFRGIASLNVVLYDANDQPIKSTIEYPKPVKIESETFGAYYIYRKQADVKVRYMTAVRPSRVEAKYQGESNHGY